MTQVELAAPDYTKSFISQVEKGRLWPSLPAMISYRPPPGQAAGLVRGRRAGADPAGAAGPGAGRGPREAAGCPGAGAVPPMTVHRSPAMVTGAQNYAPAAAEVFSFEHLPRCQGVKNLTPKPAPSWGKLPTCPEVSKILHLHRDVARFGVRLPAGRPGHSICAPPDPRCRLGMGE